MDAEKVVKYIILFILLIFVLELCSRAALYIYGHKVGDLTPYWVRVEKTDSLEVFEEYYTDSSGIMVANPDYKFDYGTPIHINSEGFRNREFKKDSSNKKKVLLIGDSFTWGSHAKPLDSCFAVLLDQHPEIITYNTGIPGTDPAQYCAIAKKYLPRLLPDEVVIALYTGNDIMVEERPIIPYKREYYQTNVGWLKAYVGDTTFQTAQEAYDFYMSYYDYSQNNIFQEMIRMTGTYTLIHAVRQQFKNRGTFKKTQESTVTGDYLVEIQRLCRLHNANMQLLIIPEYKSDLSYSKTANELDQVIYNKYRNAIKGFEGKYILPPLLANDYYPWPDGHFNNSGHYKTYKTLVQVLMSSENED